MNQEQVKTHCKQCIETVGRARFDNIKKSEEIRDHTYSHKYEVKLTGEFRIVPERLHPEAHIANIYKYEEVTKVEFKVPSSAEVVH